jgi:hypothetical protein
MRRWFSRSSSSAVSQRTVVGRAVAVVFLLLLLWSAVGVVSTAHSLRALRLGELHTAARAARIAQPVAASFATITFNKNPELQLWSALLALITNFEKSITTVHARSTSRNQSTLPPINLETPLITHLTNAAVLAPLAPDINEIIALLERSQSSLLLAQEERELLKQLKPFITASPELLETLSQGNQTWLVLFQNNDELRATGGFAGSYALVTLNEGTITEIAIEDVYDADGQFPGFVNAPPGVKEFLSSGNGLRLPDANWSPDFPTAAQQVLQFFAFGQRSGISGVIALNQEVARDILKITGPLSLPDYDAVVSAENIDSVLRTERDAFFPGSIQKKHLLDQTFTQLKLALSTLNRQQYAETAAILPKRLLSKDIQVFATNPSLQEQLDQLRVTGRASKQAQPIADFYLFAIESNVGINKANAGITRQQEVRFAPETITIQTTWQNQNYPSELAIDPAALSGESTPSARTSARTSALAAAFRELAPSLNENDQARHLAYVNYHRVLINPENTVQNIVFEGNTVSSWHEELITTAAGEVFKEVGVLIVVPEQHQGVLEITLAPAAPLQAKLLDGSPLTLTLQKQSGIGSVPHRLISPTAASSFILTHDSTHSLE